MAEQREGDVGKLFDSVRLGINAAVARGEGVGSGYTNAIYDRSGERRLRSSVVVQGLDLNEWVALEVGDGKGVWDHVIKVKSGLHGGWVIFALGVLSNEDVENYPRGSYRSVRYLPDGRRRVNRGIIYEGEGERERKIRQGYPTLKDLPEKINMEETVARFLEQVGKRDFSAPVWVEA